MITEAAKVQGAAAGHSVEPEVPKVPPGCKRTEFGVIPDDWEVSSLGSVAIIATGNTPPTADRSNYGDDYLFVSPADLGETKYVASTEKRLSGKGFASSRRFPKDSILFVSIGSTIGKCGVASVALATNQQINAVLPSPTFSSDYLYYAVCAAAPRIRALAGEQAVPIVNKTQFAGTLVPWPPLPEQRAIAEALSDVDGLLGALEAMIDKKRAIKQATMQQLLTGKARLPGFSAAWETRSFGRTLERLNAKGLQIQTSEYQVTGRYPVIDQGKMPIVGFSDDDTRLCRCPNGGVIVFGDHTCIVKFVAFDFVIGADGTQLIQAQNGHSTRFFAYQLQHVGVESTGYNRHFKFLREREFLVPPRDEQCAIATVLSDMDAEIAALERRRDKTRAIKQGMMQQLLTGRVRLVKPLPAEAGP